MNINEITKKLIGPIEPVGDSAKDKERFENLKEACFLANQLVDEIRQVAKKADRHEYSIKKAGQYAKNYLCNEMRVN